MGENTYRANITKYNRESCRNRRRGKGMGRNERAAVGKDYQQPLLIFQTGKELLKIFFDTSEVQLFRQIHQNVT